MLKDQLFDTTEWKSVAEIGEEVKEISPVLSMRRRDRAVRDDRNPRPELAGHLDVVPECTYVQSSCMYKVFASLRSSVGDECGWTVGRLGIRS